MLGLLALAWTIERFLGESTAIGVLLSVVPRGLYMGLAFAMILSALARRAWRAGGLGVAAAVLAIGPLGGIELSGAAPKTDGRVVRVVQYNVNKWDAGAEAIARSLREMEPDVACLEEAGEYRWLHDASRTPNGLRTELPGWHFAGRGEILIATKLEITAEHVEPLAPGPAARPLVEAVVKVGGQEVSVVAVHLIPTLPMQTWAEDRGDAASGTLAEIAAARHAQAERVRAYVTSLHRPAIVCGDFNARPGSGAIRLFDGVLDDAFRMRGSGFGFTVPLRLPQHRIDYVFVRGLDVKSVTVGDATTSDHYPLVAEVALR